MHCGICRVHELTRDETAFDLLSQFLGFGNSSRHAFSSFGENDLRTVCLKDVPSLDAHGLRHGEDHAISLGCCDSCKADAGVSGCGFYENRSLTYYTLLLSILDHRLGDSVLD